MRKKQAEAHADPSGKGKKASEPILPPVASKTASQSVKRAVLLEAMAASGSYRVACTTASVSVTTHYEWLATDAEYAKAFAVATDRAADTLEAVAAERSFAGSDVLLMFLLNGMRASKYFRQRLEAPVERDPREKPPPIGVTVVPFKGDDKSTGDTTPTN